ncbi:FKBP-type peptidyl-prolyl cis-trans isomerase [Myxococcaceae bacterium JPH2]|nr:FKBP-type peptidyl-prolyl cis-trans isomerase [Myxococcaceae bacterium JPH2]
MLRALTLCAFLLALPGCGSSADSGDPTKVTYAAELGVDLTAMSRQESGLYIQDLETGTGTEAVKGKVVQVHYTGWLPDGRRFDQNTASDKPFSFTLGRRQVIDGWDEGVAGMHVGGKRRLVIPSELGYGGDGAGGIIPPDSVLVFDVELVNVI